MILHTKKGTEEIRWQWLMQRTRNLHHNMKITVWKEKKYNILILFREEQIYYSCGL